MRKLISKISLALSLLFGVSLGLQAQTPEGYLDKQNFTESFDGVTATTLPLGWSRLEAQGVSSGNTVTYATTTGWIPETGKPGGTAFGNDYRNGQTKYESSTGKYTLNVYDYIIAPQAKGNLKFYVKRSTTGTAESSIPLVELYKMTKNDDGSFSCDHEKDLIVAFNSEDFPASDSEWKEINQYLGDEYQYVGFRISRAYIDEVTFDNVLIPVNKVLTLKYTDWKLKNGNTLMSDENGNYIIEGSGIVKNDGNVKLSKETEENFNFTIGRMGGYSNPMVEEYDKFDFPDLEPGEQATVTFETTIKVPEDMGTNSSGKYVFYIGYKDNFNGNSSQFAYLTLMPYKPEITMQYVRNKNGGTEDITLGGNSCAKDIFFGVTQTSMEKTFRIINNGPAPLTVEDIELPDGFKVTDIDFPCTVLNGTPKEFKVVLSAEAAETPGYKGGTLQVRHDGLVSVDKILISGEIVAADKFFADFENYKDADAMAQWYVPDATTKWAIGEYSSSSSSNERLTASSQILWPEYTVNDGRLANTQTTAPYQGIYTPLMKFVEGDKISFYAARRASTGNLAVSYSTDRVNWTPLATITHNSSNAALKFEATNFVPKRFEFDMPEGEYYISFTAGNVLLDNVVGGVIVDVPYDVVAESAEMDVKGKVNYPVNFAATFKNINAKALPAEGQTVTLYANGKAVATAEPQEIESYQGATFTFEYVPHTAGVTEHYVELCMGDDYSVKSEVLSLDIEAESALVETTVGVKAGTNASIPLAVNLGNSISEFFYKADELTSLSNNAITKIAFNYTHSGNVKYDRIRIWMINDDRLDVPDSYETMTDRETMQLVGVYENYTLSNTNSAYLNLFFDLTDPFIYEPGKNLRVVVEGVRTSGAYSAFEAAQDASINRSFYYYNSNASQFAQGTGGSKAYSKYYPVITFFTESEVLTASGTVKDSEGQPIEGALVKAESGDVYYEAETDAEGAWSMTIFQDDLEYYVTASAEGYESATQLFVPGETLDLVLYTLPEPSITIVNVDMDTDGVATIQFETEAMPETYEVTADFLCTSEGHEHSSLGHVLEESPAVVELENHDAKLNHLYTLTLTAKDEDGNELASHSTSFETTGIDGVVLIEDGAVRYIDINGVEVKNPSKGVYIRVEGNKATKVVK